MAIPGCHSSPFLKGVRSQGSSSQLLHLAEGLTVTREPEPQLDDGTVYASLGITQDGGGGGRASGQLREGICTGFPRSFTLPPLAPENRMGEHKTQAGKRQRGDTSEGSAALGPRGEAWRMLLGRCCSGLKVGVLGTGVIPLSPWLHSGGAYGLQVPGSPEGCGGNPPWKVCSSSPAGSMVL